MIMPTDTGQNPETIRRYDASVLSDMDRHADAVGQFQEYFDIPVKRPDLVHLGQIISRFATIPYENISKIIKLNKHWDADAKMRLPGEIIEDHISLHLGGTCFSLTYFLQTILSMAGFSCYPVMADMRAGRNIHCCLVVTLGRNKYLVDPGYLLHQPMEIHPAKPRLYRTEFAGIELRHNMETDSYDLSTFDRNETKWRYRFQDRPTPPAEYLDHWYASFWKPTLHGILLTKVTGQGLVYVHNTFMRETTFEGKKNMNIKREYHKIIHDIFGIDPRLIEQAQVALQENLARERACGLFSENEQCPGQNTTRDL